MNTSHLRRMLPWWPYLALIVALGCQSSRFDGSEFVRIPPEEVERGSGSEHAFDDEGPVTRVRISEGNRPGKYDAIQGEWEAVMGANPSWYQECGADCQVESASWEAVEEFVRRLNARALSQIYLPTEAEWEHAARAGRGTDTYAGTISEPAGKDPVLEGIAWCDENSGERTHPVGGERANVWEWVGDVARRLSRGKSDGSLGSGERLGPCVAGM